MVKFRGIALVMAGAILATAVLLPCRADEKKEEDKDKSLFTEDDQRGQRPRRYRLELTGEETDRVLKSLDKSDPKTAKELRTLRKQDPEKFREQLRRHGGDEYQKIRDEHSERAHQQRIEEFLNWLKKNYPREARELAIQKIRNPDIYQEKLDAARKKYEPIREGERRNPELGAILKEDLRLKEIRNELVPKIQTTKNQDVKKKLIAELEDVVGRRYDLIVERKIIMYEWLTRKLEELRNWIKKSRAEIADAKKAEVKAENVKQRMKILLEGKKGFNWGD